MKKIFIVFIFILSVCLLISCATSNEISYYTVTFDSNGATGSIDPVVVAEDSLIVKPVTGSYLIYEDHTLTSWARTPEGNGVWEFSKDRVTSDLTLYAIWSSDSVDGYMDNVESWAEEGYLYIHYLRSMNTEEDYNEWNLWIWPFAPQRYEGITAEWMFFDSSGAVAGIDLNMVYSGAGWKQDGSGPDNLTADFYQNGLLEQIGFLIVYKESKAKSVGMWQSDGGNTYVANINNIRGDYGSIHIFCVQDVVGEYKVNEVNDLVIKNPYEDLAEHEGNSNYSTTGTMPGISNDSELITTTNNGTSYTYINSSLDNSSIKTVTSDEFYGVGYQIQVSSFADSDGDGFGDIKGIINNLDYLDNLGIKVLWLTPVQLANNYHGYDVIDFYQIDPRFGTIEDYAELMEKAHARGMKVLMDLVINHTANNSTWFKASALFQEITLKDKNGVEYTADARSLFTWRDGLTENQLVDNTGTPIWYPYSTYGYYYYSSFSSNMPELNYDYQPTRDAIVDVALYWLNFGLDGFRLDAVKHIYTSLEVQSPQYGDSFAGESGNRYEANVTKNNNFFNEFASRLKAVKPDCFIVGENFDGNNDNVAPYVKSIDSQFSFTALYSISNQIDNATYPSIYYYQQGYYKFKENRTSGVGGVFIDSPFTSNHDVIRAINFVSGAAEGFYGSKNIKATLRDYYESRAKLWASIVLTLPGLPWIFYGDELGMSSNLYPNEYGNESSYMDRYYRQPFKWEYSANYQTTSFYVEAWLVDWDPYNKSLYGVKEQLLDSNSMLNFYTDMIELKNTNEALLKGDIYMWDNPPKVGVLVYERVYNGQRVLVYHNMLNTTFTDYQFTGTNYRSTPLYAQNGSSATTIGPYQTVMFQL